MSDEKKKGKSVDKDDRFLTVPGEIEVTRPKSESKKELEGKD